MKRVIRIHLCNVLVNLGTCIIYLVISLHQNKKSKGLEPLEKLKNNNRNSIE
ncbi:MAG: hypothetical protein PHC56_05775 [Herbinix sp.]|nr:hypothetical protein [Herbinix sp.]